MTNIDNTDIQLQEKSDYHLMIIFERLNTSICKWRQSTHTDLGQIHRLTRCYFPIILIIVIIIIIIIIIIMINTMIIIIIIMIITIQRLRVSSETARELSDRTAACLSLGEGDTVVR